MAKPKATTLQQRFGFADDDLKTATHDEIMLWLDQSMDALMDKIIEPMPTSWPPDHINKWEDWSGLSIKTGLEWLEDRIKLITWDSEKNKLLALAQEFRQWKFSPPRLPTRKITKLWEHAITAGSKFIVGFIDMMVVVETSGMDPSLKTIQFDSTGTWRRHWFNFDGSEEWGRDCITKPSPPSFTDYNPCDPSLFAFEVKTTLPTLGELLRQLNMYRASVNNDRTETRTIFYVVSGVTPNIDLLREQGIGFVQYPTGEVFKP